MANKEIGIRAAIDPPCDRVECFACEYRSCRILNDNDFGKRDCPFFKTREQFRADFDRYRKDGQT